MSTERAVRAWDEAMGQVSGFGGDYEAACRSMVLAGFKWVDEHPFKAPVFVEFVNVYGITEQANPSAVELRAAILDAEFQMSDGAKGKARTMATGAMVHAAIRHSMFYFHHGWDEWHTKMCARYPEVPDAAQ